MSVLDILPEPHRTVLADVLQQRAPELLQELRGKQEPTSSEWDRVTETLDDASSEHWIPGTDYEMDERGLAIDYAMGAFINAFMFVKDRERPEPPLTDEALRARLVHGTKPVRVELSEPDPAWPERFAARAADLRRALGERARLVEHIGSTSVPGLAAKPIVDIVVGIDDPDDEQAYLPDLEALGYEVRVREPGHRCLRIGEPDEPVNLHCYPPGDDEVHRYLLFRDRLRTDDADRRRYEDAKRSLAGRDWDDVNYYAEAKWPVIEAILRRAGWTGQRSR